jgi:hypothetical protein
LGKTNRIVLASIYAIATAQTVFVDLINAFLRQMNRLVRANFFTIAATVAIG